MYVHAYKLCLPFLFSVKIFTMTPSAVVSQDSDLLLLVISGSSHISSRIVESSYKISVANMGLVWIYMIPMALAAGITGINSSHVDDPL